MWYVCLNVHFCISFVGNRVMSKHKTIHRTSKKFFFVTEGVGVIEPSRALKSHWAQNHLLRTLNQDQKSLWSTLPCEPAITTWIAELLTSRCLYLTNSFYTWTFHQNNFQIKVDRIFTLNEYSKLMLNLLGFSRRTYVWFIR